MGNKKILCIIDSLGSGGAQRQLVNLAINFKRDGFDVEFVTYFPFDFYKRDLIDSSIKVTCINEKKYLSRIVKIKRFIDNSNCDIVISFLETPSFIATISLLFDRKKILIVGERSANPNIVKSIKLRFYRLFHIFTDYVVANSIANKKIVKRINPLLSTEKCKVIYNSIDTDKWSPKPMSTLKGDKRVIVVAASHQYLKNLHTLIKAVNYLSQEDKNGLVVKWFGGLREDDSFEKGNELIEKLELDNVFQFFKPTNDIKTEMLNADAVGLFSHYEGFPNVICEGMSLGKPVLCSKVSDIPIFLEHCQSFLFDSDDHIEMSKSISLLINMTQSELDEIGEHNRKVVIQNFDSEIIKEQYKSLF